MSGYGHGSPQQNGGRRMFSCKPCRMLKIKCDRKQPCTPCQVAYTAKYCLYKGDKGYDGDGVDPPKRSLQDYARSEACQNLVQSLVKADASLAEFGATTGEIQGTLKVLQAAMSTEQGIRAVKNCAEGHHEMIVNLLDAVSDS
ncbi:uncharacterized protein B0H18DRAFT_126564 [Fomitopsis serialis]|uniref:uncharacterized protein n=1 Tax=Fomitopsis serialis TaxID=139415 RepID=UPI002007CDDF|nr:uncharacterized protein B0H18DRAFT_126564 [Neoantrodia serialis]KAH9914480.1 hypothetical protein B0H18DRAFT_126564 [Neoantrodia serialis]